MAPREQGLAVFGKGYDDACRAGAGTQLADIGLGENGDTLNFSSCFDVELAAGVLLVEHVDVRAVS